MQPRPPPLPPPQPPRPRGTSGIEDLVSQAKQASAKQVPGAASPRSLRVGALEVLEAHDSKFSSRQASQISLRSNVSISPRLRTGKVAGMPAGRAGLWEKGYVALAERKSVTIGLLAEDELAQTAWLRSESEAARVFAHELSLPIVEIPLLHDYRDLTIVIDARERCLQNLRSFLASLPFVRGSSRKMCPEALRSSRAKLARMLARLRAHSTNVVELIQRWRCRLLEDPSDEAAVRELTRPKNGESRGEVPNEPFFWLGWRCVRASA